MYSVMVRLLNILFLLVGWAIRADGLAEVDRAFICCFKGLFSVFLLFP